MTVESFCSVCDGDGCVTVGGYSINPSSGVLVSDAQEAHDERCAACGGTGLEKVTRRVKAQLLDGAARAYGLEPRDERPDDEGDDE